MNRRELFALAAASAAARKLPAMMPASSMEYVSSGLTQTWYAPPDPDKYQVHIAGENHLGLCGNECFLWVQPGDVYDHTADGGASILFLSGDADGRRSRATPRDKALSGLNDWEEWCPGCWAGKIFEI